MLNQNSGDANPLLSILTNSRAQILYALTGLCLILVYGGSVFVFRPYDGLVITEAIKDGSVIVAAVDPGGPADMAGFQAGDELLTVDGKPVDPWLQAPLYRPLVKEGDAIDYQIRRDGRNLTITATMGGIFANLALMGPIVGMLVMAGVFWVIGTLLILFSPVHDLRARMISLSLLIVGVGIAAGGPAGVSCFWGANTLMKAFMGLMVFFLVAQHLYFPALVFSERWRRRVFLSFAALSIFLVLAILVDDGWIKPQLSRATWVSPLVYASFLFSALVSIALLVRNHLRVDDPDIRRQTGIVLWGTALAIAPFLTLTLIPNLLFDPPVSFVDGSLTSLLFIIIPLAYAYVIQQRKLLRVDFIINRLMVLFVFTLLIMILSFIVLGSLVLVFDLSPDLPFLGGLMAVLAALPAATVQTRVQERVNRILYGTHYDHALVTSSLSSRLAQAMERQTLVELLTDTLARQMGIRQTALFLAEGDALQRQPDGSETIPADDPLFGMLLESRLPIRSENLWNLLPASAGNRWQDYQWGRLFVPIVFEGQLSGVLILGERISNDLYSDQDIRIIATVADQAALATANIQLVETQHGLTQQLVRAEETQRKKVARELHDSVLQDLFFIKQILNSQPERIEKYLDNAIEALRQAIEAQRPPMLDHGLPLALQDLAEKMEQRAGSDGPRILWRDKTRPSLRLADDLAINLYRITQEAVANAVKHARAETIIVQLIQTDGELQLSIEDDGVGLGNDQTPAPKRHYGLLGMRERAMMVNAQLKVISEPGNGTCVWVKARLS